MKAYTKYIIGALIGTAVPCAIYLPSLIRTNRRLKEMKKLNKDLEALNQEYDEWLNSLKVKGVTNEIQS